MSIFEYLDYKLFLKEKITQLPKGGRGTSKRISELLRISTVSVSQVLAGSKHFTLEQAFQVADFFGLTTLEKEYFLLLIQMERAGTKQLRDFWKEKAQKQQKESLSVKSRLAPHTELTEIQKAQFYSNWYYSGLRVLASIEGFQTAERMAERSQLPISLVRQALAFLKESELIKESGGVYSVENKVTFIGKDSPFLNNHRRNWRLKALETIAKPSEKASFISAPLSLSREDFEWVQGQIAQLTQQISERVSKSKPEVPACLNLDWFEL